MTSGRAHQPVLEFLSAGLCCSMLLFGCVSAPNDAVNLNDGAELETRSENGLIAATVGLDQPKLRRGVNDFTIELEAPSGDALPTLSSFDAVMPAHGHEATATLIEGEAGRFRAQGVDLFMSGRWQLNLGVALDGQSDVVSFALDVP